MCFMTYLSSSLFSFIFLLLGQYLFMTFSCFGVGHNTQKQHLLCLYWIIACESIGSHHHLVIEDIASHNYSS